MRFKFSHPCAAVLVLLSAAAAAQAADATDPDLVSQVARKVEQDLSINVWGYLRGGFYGAAKGEPRAGYQLGGDLQHYRLGNEGDNYIEIGISKKFELGNGVKWGAYYMPVEHDGKLSTAQVYADVSGLSFAPGVSFWGGQRYHRIQDIHMIDNFLMQDGDNYGAGVDGIPVVAGATLNLAVHSSDSFGNGGSNPNNAKRLNFQLRDLPVNPGGKLTIAGGVVRGSFGIGPAGATIGLLHNQSDFLVKGVTHSLFAQTSSGHADLNGEFYALDVNGVAQSGARKWRVVDSLNWQVGAFGGQSVLGYEVVTPTQGRQVKDTSIGGRISYGLAQHVKLLGETAFTSRAINGQSTQHLDKEVLALALSPNTDYWTRPEFRVYVQHANWNDAAAAANSSTFGLNGRTSAVSGGVQMEAWW